MKDPAFLFYTKDFQSGTQDMSCDEVGAYLRLLMHQHQNGFVPNDTERMMRICGVFNETQFTKIWSRISDKFITNGDQMVNQKMSDLVEQRKEFKPKKTAAAAFAGLISTCKQPKEIIFELKKKFDINSHLFENESDIKISIKEWFTKMVTILVDQMVDNLGNGNAIVNGNVNTNEIVSEKEVFDLEIENKKPTSKKSNVEVLSKYHDELETVLQIFNDVLKTDYRSYKSFSANYEYWRKTYTPEEIEQAIRNIPSDSFWNDRIDPTVFFRRKYQNGENADYIGKFRNQREKTNIEKHSDNVEKASVGYIQKLMTQQA